MIDGKTYDLERRAARVVLSTGAETDEAIARILAELAATENMRPLAGGLWRRQDTSVPARMIHRCLACNEWQAYAARVGGELPLHVEQAVETDTAEHVSRIRALANLLRDKKDAQYAREVKDGWWSW